MQLREILDQIASGYFSPGEPRFFKPLVDNWLEHDNFMLLADYQSYIDCQDGVSVAFQNTKNWTRMSLLNVARIGYFSSDRAIREYCQRIWNIRPASV